MEGETKERESEFFFFFWGGGGEKQTSRQMDRDTKYRWIDI